MLSPVRCPHGPTRRHGGRVSALENEVRDPSHEVHVRRQDAAAARVLAGGADRDVMEIRAEIRDFRTEIRAEVGDFRHATTAGIKTLREDQLDIRRQMAAGFAKVDDNFAEMRGKFDATAAGQQQIVELLNTVISRQDGE